MLPPFFSGGLDDVAYSAAAIASPGDPLFKEHVQRSYLALHRRLVGHRRKTAR